MEYTCVGEGGLCGRVVGAADEQCVTFLNLNLLLGRLPQHQPTAINYMPILIDDLLIY